VYGLKIDSRLSPKLLPFDSRENDCSLNTGGELICQMWEKMLEFEEAIKMNTCFNYGMVKMHCILRKIFSLSFCLKVSDIFILYGYNQKMHA
jgi:hypothetical protein